MVKYETILKVIEYDIKKCSITLKSIREQINPLLKRITDSQEEYDILMKEIPYFYRDHYNSDHEELFMQYLTGETFNAVGDESSVRLSWEDSQKTYDMGKNGVYPLISIHNHPSGVNFLSIGDVGSQALKNEKYTVVVSKKGIAINKLNEWDEDNELQRKYKCVASYWSLERKTKQKIKNHPRTKKLEEDTNRKLSEAKTHSERMDVQRDSHKKMEELVDNYIISHMEESKKSLNRGFKENNVPMRMEIIDIKKSYEQ